MILNQLGISSWKEVDENLVLTSLITGYPLPVIGNHGCAKTYVPKKVAQALEQRSVMYGASKTMFARVTRI